MAESVVGLENKVFYATKNTIVHNYFRREIPVSIPRAPILGDNVPDFIRTARPQVIELFQTAKPYSLAEYLAISVNEGLNALEEGNYGVGALEVIWYKGHEFIFTGHNRLRSLRNSHFHAEEDAIDAAEAFLNGQQTHLDRLIWVRKAPETHLVEVNPDVPVRIIVSNLECCTGCQRRTETHKADAVFIGMEDELAGAYLGERLESLPFIWKMLTKWHNTKVILAQYDGDNNSQPTDKGLVTIDKRFRKLINDTFLINRELIDKELERIGLAPSDMTLFLATVAHHTASIGDEIPQDFPTQ